MSFQDPRFTQFRVVSLPGPSVITAIQNLFKGVKGKNITTATRNIGITAGAGTAGAIGTGLILSQQQPTTGKSAFELAAEAAKSGEVIAQPLGDLAGFIRDNGSLVAISLLILMLVLLLK